MCIRDSNEPNQTGRSRLSAEGEERHGN